MSTSVSSLNASLSALKSGASVVSSSSSSSSSTSATDTAGLTDEQKKKIAQIEADYAAKKITKAVEEQRIAQVKAEAVSNNQSAKSTQTTKVVKKAEKPKEAEETKEIKKAKTDISKKLKELGVNVEPKNLTETDVDVLKSTSDTDQGILVDEKI